MTWYGTIDLQVTSFKQLFEVTLGKMLQTEPAGPTDSLTPYLNSAAVQDGYVESSNLKSMWASETDRKNLSVRANDLVVCEGGDVGRSALVKADSSAIFQNSVHRVRPRPGSDIRFAKYTLDALRSSSYLDVLCNKATIRHFTADKLANLEIPHASPDYQRAACDFLDRETAQIDELIGKQERLIELLVERRFAVLEEILAASSSGLSPLKLKRAARVTVGIVITPSEWYAEEGVIALRGLNVEAEKITLTNTVRLTQEGHLHNRKSELRAGDVVVVRTGQAGAAAVVPDALDGCNAIDLLLIRPTAILDGEYLAMAINATSAQEQVRRGSVGAIQAHFNVSELRELSVSIPELPRQRRAVKVWRQRSAEIDLLILKLRAALELMRERRSALISSAVTGKIDIQAGASQF